MTNKKCLVFEDLGNITQNMTIVEGSNADEIRLTGVFGQCGIKNANNRIYDKENYGRMVEALQHTIMNEGCPGELEHPNSMNIDLNNVSHKIESIEMNEDGTITGTILLLDTDKGRNAKAIVKGGLPLYISSRGAGSIDESGHVTLSTIKTYDLVGTPGFQQAKLSLKKNQKFECLNESLEDGNYMYAIVEGEDDDLLGGGGDDNKSQDNNGGSEPDNKGDNKDDNNKDNQSTDGDKKDPEPDNNDDNKNSDKDTTMNELKEAIDKLTEKVTSLEAELHVAQESLTAKETELNAVNEKLGALKNVNYGAIEQWVNEEFAPEFKTKMNEELATSIKEAVNTDEVISTVKNWVCEEFAPIVQNWVVEEFAPEVQGWVTEEFAPEVQNWVCEEFAPEVQGWVCEEFAPEVQGWVCEEFAPTVEGWINEELIPETSQTIQTAVAESVEAKVNDNINAFMESQKTTKLSEIDALLESLEDKKDNALELLKESQKEDQFAGLYVIENMPAQYKPSWNTLDESRKQEIVRQSRAYNFTKEGVLESFWSHVDFMGEKPVQQVNEGQTVISNYHNSVAAQMMRLRQPLN